MMNATIADPICCWEEHLFYISPTSKSERKMWGKCWLNRSFTDIIDSSCKKCVCKDKRKSMNEKEQKSEELGKRLRREREQHFLTQKELAELIGVTEMTIYRWENGESKPRPYAQRKLMKALHLKKGAFLLEHEPQNIRQKSSIILSSTRQVNSVLPSPSITRIYKGWRAGMFVPQMPGRNAPMLYEEDEYGDIHVTVNNYPLDCYYVHDVCSNSPCFDWGRISARSEQLAVSLLTDYFGECGPRGKEDTENYQARKYLFQFWVKVVAFLPYEKWELSSDQISGWLEREIVKEQIQLSE